MVLEVVAEDGGIATLDGGDALLLLQLLDGRDQIAILRRQLKLLLFGGGVHALGQRAGQFRLLTFEEETHVAYCLRVSRGRSQVLDTGTQAASDEVLQAGTRMITVQVDLAARDQEVAVD